MPINFRLAPDEIDYILEDAGSVALICDSPAPGVRPVRVVLDVESDYEAALASAAPQREPANVVEDDAALMCYTSGTTGWPNGALLTDRGSSLARSAGSTGCELVRDDVWLSGLPLGR